MQHPHFRTELEEDSYWRNYENYKEEKELGISKQVYDKEGTTDFHCVITTNEGNGMHQWILHFSQGLIHMYSTSMNLDFQLRFPEDEHWTSEYFEPTKVNDAMKSVTKIKTSEFILQVDILEVDDTDKQSYLIINMGMQEISVEIPFVLGTNLVKFAAGSTDLDSVVHATKS